MRNHRHSVMVGVVGVLSAALALASAATDVPVRPAVQDLTVTGCVERDAASSTPLFKIIVPEPGGGTAIYLLSAPEPSPVPAAVGKVAQISGPVRIEKRAGRDVRVLDVRSLKVVASRCG